MDVLCIRIIRKWKRQRSQAMGKQSTLEQSRRADDYALHPPPQNQTLCQTFEWYLEGTTGEVSDDGVQRNDCGTTHWRRLIHTLPFFDELGVTSLWLPPACKASSLQDVGYGIYDLFDLGEFDAKGAINTKWGSKGELQDLCQQARDLGIGILFDAVLNHRAAADQPETCEAVQVDSRDRRIEIGQPHMIESYTKFNYAARNGRYSALSYNKNHFSGVDYDNLTKSTEIFKIVGPHKPGWATDVDEENGNYDYLMFADVDYSNKEVQVDVLGWGTWLRDQLPGLTGIRLDAIKHYSRQFQDDFIQHVNRNGPNKLFWVGEYWKADSKFLSRHVDKFNEHLHLFDVTLVYNFHNTSYGRIKDLRRVLSDTLVELRPDHAVTFVANHDTQEEQALAAPVQPWFVPHSYAFILLRNSGHPCVFWGDLFGISGPKPRPPACDHRLGRLLLARKQYAYGEQVDYFDDPHCVAWFRAGHPFYSSGAGLVVMASISSSRKSKRIYVGVERAGQIWVDLMGWTMREVSINRKGFGKFRVQPRTISVWTTKGAPGQADIQGFVQSVD